MSKWDRLNRLLEDGVAACAASTGAVAGIGFKSTGQPSAAGDEGEPGVPKKRMGKKSPILTAMARRNAKQQ